VQIIIHIGTHKTGSTAIQHFFNRNREEFYSHGLYYPQGQETWHGHPQLAMMVRSDSTSIANEYVNSVIEEAKDHKCDKVFFSSEFFSHINAQNNETLKPPLWKCSSNLSA